MAPQGVGKRASALDVAADAGQLQEIRESARRFHPARLTVLTDFPRIEDVTRIRAAGAAAVLSKPVLLEDLFWQLQQAVG